MRYGVLSCDGERRRRRIMKHPPVTKKRSLMSCTWKLDTDAWGMRCVDIREER